MKLIIIILFLVSTKLVFGQINNGSFEVWDTVYTNEYTAQLDSVFLIQNPMAGKVSNWKSGSQWGINRTTDNYSGNYSLILHNWYNYVEEWIKYHESINSRPQFLQGYYKYITGGVDGLSIGTAIVTLTRFNGITNDTVATGIYEFDSTASFKPFKMNLIYQSSSIPDSISIHVINSDRICLTNSMCHFLYLDDLSLSYETSSVENYEINNICVYPNPVKESITFKLPRNEYYTAKIYNILGKLEKSVVVSDYSTIPMENFNQGIKVIILLDSQGRNVFSDKILKE